MIIHQGAGTIANIGTVIQRFRTMNIRQIETFMAVAKHGSFRRASEELHLSPSAASTHVQRLEEEIGLKLLERTTRKVLLTAACEKLMLHSKSVLSELRSVVRDLREEAGPNHGTVSIGCAPSLCYHRLPRALVAYQRSFPGVTLQLHESFAQRMYLDLSERTTDFAIGPRMADRSGFDLRPVWSDHFVAVLPNTKQWAGRKSIKFGDIAGEPQLCLGPASATLSAIETTFRSRGLTYSPRFQVLQQQTLFSLVEHGMGIALVPATCVDHHSGDYIVAKLIEPTIDRQLFIITLKDRRLSLAAQQCADMIGAELLIND